jgi:glyoxylase-like metal-dependent hydrolase (beta-lactamase superfamily II)
MAIGDLYTVEGTDVHYVDVGLYEIPEMGSVYLIDADRPAVVDTGAGANYESITEGLAELGIEPGDLAYVVATHVHLDHAGGVGYLARDCPEATVLTHETGAPHLVDPERLVEGTKAAVGEQWRFYAEPLPVPEERVRAVGDGDRIDLGDRELVVHHAPGHAPHQVVLAAPWADAVFTADAAGIYQPSRDELRPTTPPSRFDVEQSYADLETLRGLEPELLLYGHYGPAPADGRLDGYERLLREWVADIEAARERMDDEAVIEQFETAALEEMTDVWPEWKARAEARINVRGILGYLDYRERGGE